MLPLNPLYAAGLAWKNRGFDRHPERARRLMQPVVSAGSLSAGGAGKTPFVISLGRALRNAGVGIDVLSRGHGRQGDATLRVSPTGNAEEYGDEPLLIARQLLCPVYVGRERFAAGEMAERERRHLREDKSFSVHLLDDGFQHRQLARAVDIVLLTAEEARDALLPAGNLREPLQALQRGGVVVVREDEAAELEPVLRPVAAPVWVIRRRFAFTEGVPSARPLAFCGIARPEGFRAALTGHGVEPVELVALRDHVAYDADVVSKLVKRARAVGADGFVTTAKDAVKLTPALRAALGHVAVSDVIVEMDDAPRRVAELVGMIEASWG